MKKRILLIDDDPAILDALHEALKFEQFEVSISQTIDHIFDTIHTFKPDLVMIDYILSGINGGEICHQIKTSKKHSEIKVILMSAFPRVIESLGTYNCDLFVSKPFDLYDLVKQINELISSEKPDLV